MDQRPIGVFDSGLGGLTAVRELIRLMPHEDIIYFGDTGRVPYGVRSKDTIIKYVRQDVSFLQSHDIKAVVIACNTADTAARSVVKQELSIPVFGVVEPSALMAARVTKNGRIGLIGTPATVGSGAYDGIISAANPQARVYSAACPLFVPMVENGRFSRGDRVIELVVEEYLSPMRERNIDTLVLGCTHYPLLEQVIGDFMGPDVQLINSGACAAKAVAGWLEGSGVMAERERSGVCSYFVSDSPDDFSRLSSIFMRCELSERAGLVDISAY